MIKTLLLFTLLLLHYSNLEACSCTRGARLVKEEVKRSKAVVVGTVLSIKEVQAPIEGEAGNLAPIVFHKVQLKVATVFKGKKRWKKITVYTGMGKGDCGFVFREQQQYIVYIVKQASPFARQGQYPKKYKHTLWTDICTRTQTLKEVELKALEAL